MRRYPVILHSLLGAIHYAYAAAWNESVDDINHFIGLGFRCQFNPFDIDMRYSYNWANTDVNYDAASNRAFANTENGNQPINNGFPAMTFARHILKTGLRWNLHKDASMRFYHHYEHSSTRDWHQDGLSPLIGRIADCMPCTRRTRLSGVSNEPSGNRAAFSLITFFSTA